MLLSFRSRLDWMPNSICRTNRPSGFDRPAHSSEENFVNCAIGSGKMLRRRRPAVLKPGKSIAEIVVEDRR